MKENIWSAIKDDATVSVEEICIIEEDLSLLFRSLTSLYESGIVWEVDNYGVTRDEMSAWRHELIQIRRPLKERLKELLKICKKSGQFFNGLWFMVFNNW